MPESIGTIDEYIVRLRQELAGADPALVQDAVYDATSHLRSESESLARTSPALTEAERVARVVDAFGAPDEVADAWRRNEATVSAALRTPPAIPPPTVLGRVFGVFTDPHAYGALFYMLFSLVTGIVYFTWAVTGIALSVGLAVLIFGIPFILFFLGTTRALSLVEGRLVEGLLGVRMPRRPVPAPRGSIGARIKGWLTDARTWTTLVYMLLKLPLGIFTFTLFVFLLSSVVGIAAIPFVQEIAHLPAMQIEGVHYDLARWAYPLVLLGSFALLLATMHLARVLGMLHGALAKVLLVARADGSVAPAAAAGTATVPSTT